MSADALDSEKKRRSGPTGIATYIGTWSGTSEGIIVNGTFEVTVDLDNGTVSGSISGDAVTTLSGTANESGLTVTGAISGYTLRWWGTYSSDKSSASGNWEYEISSIGFGHLEWHNGIGSFPAFYFKKLLDMTRQKPKTFL